MRDGLSNGTRLHLRCCQVFLEPLLSPFSRTSASQTVIISFLKLLPCDFCVVLVVRLVVALRTPKLRFLVIVFLREVVFKQDVNLISSGPLMATCAGQ